MYCDITIPLEYKQEEIMLVVTELIYLPAEKRTRTSPAVPEAIEILAGYGITKDGRGIEFWDVYPEEDLYINEKVMEWYKRDLRSMEESAYDC